MKKYVGNIVNPASIGVISNRPPTRGEQSPVKIPDLNDLSEIAAQREQLRQEEANRYKKSRN